MKNRYRLSQHEEGTWNVIDEVTGGPVVVDGVVLYRLDIQLADALRDALEVQDEFLQARLSTILKDRGQDVP